jgi:hypothetical protein
MREEFVTCLPHLTKAPPEITTTLRLSVRPDVYMHKTAGNSSRRDKSIVTEFGTGNVYSKLLSRISFNLNRINLRMSLYM